LANPRDFEYPVAAFDAKEGPFVVYNKYIGELFQSKQNCSPFNVVAWVNINTYYNVAWELCTIQV
jgi:homogentisate 1,2-dioxygenase